MNSSISLTDMMDSETESLVVHSNGDANLEDLSETEFETDVEIENGDEVKMEFRNLKNDSSSLKQEPRAKTRLLSRSHSVDDINNHQDTLSTNELEPPRRNSSGEFPAQTYDIDIPTSKPSANVSLQDIELPRYKYNVQHRNSLSPTSSIQPSPISMQYATQTSWKNIQTAQDKEDEFSILLQTTAERVLNKLKTRQQDLGSNLSIGQKYQRRPSHCLQPPVPRKLQPITRDGNKTPRSECDLKSVCSESDLGPLSAA